MQEDEDLAFTDYVQSLTSDGGLDQATLDAAWEKARRLLIRKLKVRSLWTMPPRIIGVLGYPSWQTPGALHELLQDAFTHVFVERLPYLSYLLEAQDEIDRLACCCLRNFIHDRQKKHDPLGFQIYGLLSQAIDGMIETNELYVVNGDPEMRNTMVLGFTPEVTPEAVELVVLDIDFARWSEEIAPAIRDQRRAEGIDSLKKLLAGLAEHLPAFRFGDVVGPLKVALRQHLSQLWQHDGGVTLVFQGEGQECELVRRVHPRAGFITQEFFETLIAAVDRNLRERAGRARRQRAQTESKYLRRLWNYVKLHTAESNHDSLPSARRLGPALDIPRKRIPKLLELLGAIVLECWSELEDGNLAASVT